MEIVSVSNILGFHYNSFLRKKKTLEGFIINQKEQGCLRRENINKDDGGRNWKIEGKLFKSPNGDIAHLI